MKKEIARGIGHEPDVYAVGLSKRDISIQLSICSLVVAPGYKKWLRLVGQLRAFLKWCLAYAASAAVRRAGRLLKYT